MDLSKVFDTVDHVILLNRLHVIGLSGQAVNWFLNYFSGRTQFSQSGGYSSTFLPVTNGVSQGPVLGPLLFSIYVNNLCENLLDAAFHFYADDTCHLLFIPLCGKNHGPFTICLWYCPVQTLTTQLTLKEFLRINILAWWLMRACLLNLTLKDLFLNWQSN